jgi:hypothetical protein
MDHGRKATSSAAGYGLISCLRVLGELLVYKLQRGLVDIADAIAETYRRLLLS